jgi:arsenate reductase
MLGPSQVSFTIGTFPKPFIQGIDMAQKCTIYHNPRCSKSRQTLALLEAKGVEPDVVLYLEDSPDAATLKDLLKKLGLGPRDLLRKGEDAYKDLGLSDLSLTDLAIINAMVAHPKLIERPIVIKGKRAVLGRPPENVLELL